MGKWAATVVAWGMVGACARAVAPPVAAGDGHYVLLRDAGTFESEARLRRRTLEEARRFCAAQGQVAELAPSPVEVEVPLQNERDARSLEVAFRCRAP